MLGCPSTSSSSSCLSCAAVPPLMEATAAAVVVTSTSSCSSSSSVILMSRPGDDGAPRRSDFFFAVDTTVTVPPTSGEVCVAGSSSWFRTLGRFFSPRALARAMASATMRLAFSCLQRISTRRTEAGSPGALVMRMAWD
ncbi:hypothetical protein EYF80_036188 [Liparis tanakae]|uniref:Uncharacterized protein n=1 Tax=Liparis tanakae TaxID=230148 RepID=A0A4Z2GLD2_9TELE|nr:hypothetical protein EYF80_036188 [Liparis tanakae]